MNPKLKLLKNGKYKDYEYEIRENEDLSFMSIGLNAYIKVPNNEKIEKYIEEGSYEYVNQIDENTIILGFDTHHGWDQFEFEGIYKNDRTLENRIEYIEEKVKLRIEEIEEA